MNEDPFKNRPLEPRKDNDPVQTGQEKLAITIEVAGPADWEEYKKIRLEALKDSPSAFSYSTKNWDEKWKKDSGKNKLGWQDPILHPMQFVMLLKEGTDVRGVAVASKKKDQKGVWVWRISEVYVTRKLQGSGLGERLLRKVIDEIKSRKGAFEVKKITLNVNKAETQKSAFNLYKKLGFKEVKRLTEYFQKFWEMELDLTAEKI